MGGTLMPATSKRLAVKGGWWRPPDTMMADYIGLRLTGLVAIEKHRVLQLSFNIRLSGRSAYRCNLRAAKPK